MRTFMERTNGMRTEIYIHTRTWRRYSLICYVVMYNPVGFYMEHALLTISTHSSVQFWRGLAHLLWLIPWLPSQKIHSHRTERWKNNNKQWHPLRMQRVQLTRQKEKVAIRYNNKSSKSNGVKAPQAVCPAFAWWLWLDTTNAYDNIKHYHAIAKGGAFNGRTYGTSNGTRVTFQYKEDDVQPDDVIALATILNDMKGKLAKMPKILDFAHFCHFGREMKRD